MFGKKKAETEQEPQYYRSFTGELIRNYKVYYFSGSEKLLYFIGAFVVGAAVGLLFYGGLAKNEFGQSTRLTYILDLLIILICGFAAGKLFLPVRQKQLLESRKKKLRKQFRDMLEALTTALGAGKNVQDAFLSVQEDMKNQYEEGADILTELEAINNGIANGFVLEKLLANFGARSGIDDIQNFADVFEITYRMGGNVKETLRNTSEIIGDKMSVEEEIETTVSGSKSEQAIMLVMPVLLIGMIKVSSPEFGSNFATSSGVIATTIGVALFIISYFVGKRLLEIRI